MQAVRGQSQTAGEYDLAGSRVAAAAALAASAARRESCELGSASPAARADSVRDLYCHATLVDGVVTGLRDEEIIKGASNRSSSTHLRVEALSTGWNGLALDRQREDRSSPNACAETVLQGRITGELVTMVIWCNNASSA